MKQAPAITVLCVLALLLDGSIVLRFRNVVFHGYNDFAQLYAAGRLAGTNGLYDPVRIRREQPEIMDQITPDRQNWRYMRLPFCAAFLWPLARLPYQAAYSLFELLALAALAGFVAIWRPPSLAITLLYTAISFPVLFGLMGGQDIPFLLFFIAVAVQLLRRNKPFLAGLVFSLCAAKFHMFLLIPMWLLGQRQKKFAAGLVSGGAVLFALSFAAGGLSWPRDYLSMLRDPAGNPALRHMPNLHAVFTVWASPRLIEWLAYVAVAVGVWWIARRMEWEYALGATLAGGILVSYHSYLQDCSLLLPAALLIFTATSLRSLRLLVVLLLLPVAQLTLESNPPYSLVVPLGVLLMIGLMVGEAWRRPQAALAPATSLPSEGCPAIR